MRQITVHLTVIAVILLVIFSSGNQNVTGYLSQSIFNGQSIYVTDQQTAFVNDEYHPVIHTGLAYTESFQVSDMVDLFDDEYVVIDHSVSGGFGKPTVLFTNITSSTTYLEQNLSLGGLKATYVSNYQQTDGKTFYIYNVTNFTVAISEKDFSVVEYNQTFYLLQQIGNTTMLAQIQQPFSVTILNLGVIVAIIIAVMVIAYLINKKKGVIYYE